MGNGHSLFGHSHSLMGKKISKDLDTVQVGDLIVTGPEFTPKPKSGYLGVVLGVDSKTATIHWFALGETLKQSIGTVSRALKIGTWERYEGRRSINL